MITIRNQQTGSVLGQITPEDLQLLRSQMVDDSANDHDYYINESELLNFQEAGASPALLQLLKDNLDENGELDIEWDES